jgi:hypothetical protein
MANQKKDTIKFYIVLEDGTLDEETEFTPESTKVIIIVDDRFKRIYLWKGANSGIKKKIIGSRAAAELRKTYYGFAYRLSVIEEGDETQEFEFTIKRSRGEADVGVVDQRTRGIPTSPSEMQLDNSLDFKIHGKEPAKKIIYSDNDKADMQQFAGSRPDMKVEEKSKQSGPRPQRPPPPPKEKTARRQPQRTILSQMMGDSGKEPKIIRPHPDTHKPRKATSTDASARTSPPPTPQESEVKTGQKPTTRGQPPKPASSAMIEEVDPKKAFDLIKELGVPAGYERDLVIVGTGVYKQRGNDFLVPPDPPEGVFLAPDRVPRIIIENGVVKVVEVLKKIAEKEKPKKDEPQFDQDIEDLMSTFQIEIE